MTGDARRQLPAVGTLLESEGVRALRDVAPPAVLASAVRRAIDVARTDLGAAPQGDVAWTAAVRTQLDRLLARSLRPVINATGVVLHTNLGRAPLAPAALSAVSAVASGYSTLEYDLDAGHRGSRHRHCAALLRELTGAEDAFVVNNCAAALVLALNTLANGRDALISRGELVEIGGSFRVPDIMGRSGARLVEVGTTNRTHHDDYRDAISPATAAIVSVHRSNFVQEGFVASVPTRQLAALAADAGIALIHDFGSGLMLDLAPWGLSGEPTASDAIAAGASVVVMSGDKLLGGPQSGIVLGSGATIAAMRDNPLARALRVDKLTLAALEATLELYRDPPRAVAEIPVLAMLTAPADGLRARAAAAAQAIAGRGVPCRAIATEATVGGGAFPTARLASHGVQFDTAATDAAEARLRGGATPVIGRITDGRLHLDLRTVSPESDVTLVDAVVGALAE